MEDLSQFSGEEVMDRLRRDINNLQSEDFQVRQTSLSTLLPLLSSKSPLRPGTLYLAALQHVRAELAKPLLKCVSDRKEKVRELAWKGLIE